MANLPRDDRTAPRAPRTRPQAIRFPLETTCDELVDLCGAGIYRVYALDAIGTQIADEQIAKWDLTPSARDVRNGALEAPPLLSSRANGGTGAVTDLRFVLEAVTQMMRTNSEALRIVTDSQVDLAKTLVTAKGLRNATLLAPLPVAESTNEEDDDKEDDTSKSHPVVELLMPFAQKVAEMMPGLVMAKVMAGDAVPADAKALAAGAESASSEDARLADRPRFELRDFVDFQYAKRKGDAKRAAKQPSERTRAEAMAALQTRVTADPALLHHLVAIKEQLAADGVETLMNVVGGSTEAEQAKFIDAIKALPRPYDATAERSGGSPGPPSRPPTAGRSGSLERPEYPGRSTICLRPKSGPSRRSNARSEKFTRRSLNQRRRCRHFQFGSRAGSGRSGSWVAVTSRAKCARRTSSSRITSSLGSAT